MTVCVHDGGDGVRLRNKHQIARPSTVAERHVAGEIQRALKELEGRATDEAVHEARRAIKRARAGMRLIRECVGKKDFDAINAALREAGQAMSGARDERVLAQTVGRLVEGSESRKEKELVESAAQLLHIKAEEEAAKALDAPGVRKKLRKACSRVKKLEWAEDDAAVIERGLAHTRERFREAMREAFKHETDEAMHTWRKRVQDLRFQLLMVEEWLTKKEVGVIKRAKLLSELLGVDHDFAVLGERIAERPGMLLKVRVGVEKMIAREREGLRKKARTAGILMLGSLPRTGI